MNQHEETGVISESAVHKQFHLSKTRTMTIDEILNDKVMWTSDVTGIPIGLLRTPQTWVQPIDMMIYLHYFTQSFGRNRRWCNMGILELQKFCAGPGKLASKNTIRGSLTRLIARRLIECIEPEAANQKTRKWLVRTPIEAELGCCKRETWVSETGEENKPAPKPDPDNPPNPQPSQAPTEKHSEGSPVAASDISNSSTTSTPSKAGSTVDPVKNSPSQNPTQTGSTTDRDGVKNLPGEGQNLTQTGSTTAPYKHPLKDPSQDPPKDPSLKHPSISEVFENYFSKIRAPKTEKNERFHWNEIQMRNADVTEEEFLECYNLVSETKDANGKPVVMKFLWMAKGFDTILTDARQKIRSRKRQEEERLQKEKKAQEDSQLEQTTSPEDVKLAKDAVRAILGQSGLINPIPTPAQSSRDWEKERRAFLLAQARQIQQIEKFGNL